VVKDKDIIAKYRNPHILRWLSTDKRYDDDVMVFGDFARSKILEKPLLFDKILSEKLDLNIKFRDDRTENQSIVSATRSWRELSNEKVQILLDEAKLTEGKAGLDNIMPTVKVDIKPDETKEIFFERPQWLMSLIDNIELLKQDPGHKERAHESLVESFYELLGFAKYQDIKHRQGRIDISIEHKGKVLIVNEVKKDWHLSHKDNKVLMQAYNYALISGARYVILTNGDYYAIYDRVKGSSYDTQFVGDFRLSELTKEYAILIDKLKKEKICI
ncbi:MAG: type I restriction enzyme HsdR N-terminal domain-containing protein, partial [Candidatus Omnitrophica bacterium]|nr:type I restriction enzyme HsdR N-terminal domain-containing protein [Candidatus Omnitrophota bacterium]